MRCAVEGIWLRVPCDAPDLAVVHIAVGDEPTDWVGAYRDFDARGQRTAQILYRPEYAGGTVWVRVDGKVTPAGPLRAGAP